MAIEIIDKLKQKNNGSFKLVDAEDVDYDGSGKSLKDKIDELISSGSGISADDIVNDFTTGGIDKAASAETIKILNNTKADKQFTVKYNKDSETCEYYNGTSWIELNISSGGGATIGSLTSNFSQTTCNIDEEIIIDYFFTSPNIGKGTLYVTVNDIEVSKTLVSQGSGNINIGILKKGRNVIKLYVADSANIYTNNLSFVINCGSLELTSDFDSSQDFLITDKIEIPFNVDTISTEPIYLKLNIDGEQKEDKICENGYNLLTINDLFVGSHKITMYLVSGSYTSNILNYTIIITAADTLVVSTSIDTVTAEEGEQLNIDYRISMLNQNQFNVNLYIDSNLFKTLKVYPGINYWNISTLTEGEHKLEIEISTIDGVYTEKLTITAIITASSYEAIKPITQGLLAWFDATDKNNSDTNKDIWEDKSGNGTVARLYGFNFNTNGWIDNKLLCNGNSYVEIDLTPFADNAISSLTIDIQFTARDIGNSEARVLDCTSLTSPYEGCYINTLDAYLVSRENNLRSAYSENELTRATFVIDRTNKFSKVYINSVMCEPIMLSDSGTGTNKVYESFQHNQKIYINSRKGQDLFGSCEVDNIRIFRRALSDEEILQNHMADIKDRTEQKAKYDMNYNNAMPTMYFYGDTSKMTKENAVPLRVKYISTNDAEYGQSFDLPACSVSWQGTSSLQYIVKNYKIKLKDAEGNKYKYTPFKNGIRESTFCLKCDYMESSHANNTGMAKFINDCLYDELNPAQKLNSNVRNTINGFPIQLYINDELIGIFNFNLDKGCTDSFGIDNKTFPNCLSYEVTANSDITAGAFNKWTSNSELTEQEYYARDFEIRYPKEREENDDHAELIRLVNWVSDATDEEFKNNLEQYFNKEYLFKYFLNVMVFGQVDNLGKNMMITTWDGNIWYPQFYDLDF